MTGTSLVAIYAAVVATGGLIWQVYMFRQHERVRKEQEAARVEVSLASAVLVGALNQPVVSLKMVNRSKHPVRVTGFYFRHQHKKDRWLFTLAFTGGTSLPQVIPSQDSYELHLDRAKLEIPAADEEDRLDFSEPLTAEVNLATGETFASEPTRLA